MMHAKRTPVLVSRCWIRRSVPASASSPPQWSPSTRGAVCHWRLPLLPTSAAPTGRVGLVRWSTHSPPRSFSASAAQGSSTHGREQQQRHRPRWLFSSFLSWYAGKLDSHPLLTKAISSGLIAAAGDMICQALIDPTVDGAEHAAGERRPDEGSRGGGKAAAEQSQVQDGTFWDRWDVPRTGRFLVLGAALIAPMIHYWYGLLATTISPGTHAKSVARRVLLDQFAFAPFMMSSWLCSFWTLQNLLDDDRDEGTRTNTSLPPPAFSEMPRKCYEDLPSLLVANWALWIPAQMINFRFVPLPFQVLYSNVVSLLWNTYLSFATSSPESSIAETGSVDKDVATGSKFEERTAATRTGS